MKICNYFVILQHAGEKNAIGRSVLLSKVEGFVFVHSYVSIPRMSLVIQRRFSV